MMLASFLFFVINMAMLATGQGDFIDVMYEVASALSTTGLSRGLTPNMNIVGKVLIMITMYIGRIGPITLVVALLKRKHLRKGGMTLPTEHVIIG
jgi:trk system potassium uptake protein TrkH